MPKAKGRGGKNRRRAKNTSNDVKRELVFKEQDQEYAQVLKMLGGGRCDLYCFDGVKRLGTIRGKLVKRVWITQGDIVLVSLREFQKDSKKCDIAHKYFADEAKKLKAYKEIPENTELNTAEQDTDPNFVFGDESGSDDGDSDDEEVGANRREMPESSDSDEDDDDREERKSRDSIDDI